MKQVGKSVTNKEGGKGGAPAGESAAKMATSVG